MRNNYSSRPYAAITAVGGYLPQGRRTNFDLEQVCDTSDEWIVKRTGIKERRIIEQGLATSDMAVMAIQDLCTRYHKHIADEGSIIVATTTHYVVMTATANIIRQKFDIKNVWNFDMNAACSGFLYALDMGASLVESDRYKNVLVVEAD